MGCQVVMISVGEPSTGRPLSRPSQSPRYLKSSLMLAPAGASSIPDKLYGVLVTGWP